jgi:uncharacterized RDD family membrane protein YckC
VTVYEDSVSKILSTLSHPLRRDILNFIHEKGECSFTDLLNKLEVDTGKLSFHLRTLSAFTEQTTTGKYKLSKTGERALRVIRDVEMWAEGADVKRKAAHLPYASFKDRSLAFLFDAGLMLAITLILASAEVVPFLMGGTFTITVGTIPFVALGLLYVYSTLLEGFNGQTIGKRLVGLKVVRMDGKKLSYEHAAVRNFGKAFLLPVDLLVEIKEENILRYFDKFAGTTVINLRAPLQPKSVMVEKAVDGTAEKNLAIAA